MPAAKGKLHDLLEAMHSVRPRVLATFSTSIDGKINPVPSRRGPNFLMSQSSEDRCRTLALRTRVDAILIGANDLRTDDPELGLDRAERERRAALGQPEPFRVVVTHSGQAMGPHMRMFDRRLGGPSIVVHPAMMPAIDREILAPCARLVELGKTRVEFGELLEWLCRELAVRTLLCEGGGTVCAELFAIHAVDELFVTLVPRILGGRDAPTLAAGPGLPANDVPEGKLLSLERVGDELFLQYGFAAA